jgi:hypothetical protein
MDRWHGAIMDAKASATCKNALWALQFRIWSTKAHCDDPQGLLAHIARMSLSRLKEGLLEARLLGLIESENGRIYACIPRRLDNQESPACPASEDPGESPACTATESPACRATESPACRSSSTLEDLDDLDTETFVDSAANSSGCLDVNKEETQTTEDSANGTELNPTACAGVTPKAASQGSGSASKQLSKEEALAISLAIEAVIDKYCSPDPHDFNLDARRKREALVDQKTEELRVARIDRRDKAAAVAIAHQLMAAEGRRLRGDRNGLGI